MGTHRRIMGADYDDESDGEGGPESSAWKNPWADNGDEGSEYNVLRGRSSIFDDETENSKNPIVTREAERRLDMAVDGPGMNESPERETLVAVFPKGKPPLVARALRNVNTGAVQQLEPYRNASVLELETIRRRGQMISLGDAGADAGAPSDGLPWKKIFFASALTVGGIYAWRHFSEKR